MCLISSNGAAGTMGGEQRMLWWSPCCSSLLGLRFSVIVFSPHQPTGCLELCFMLAIVQKNKLNWAFVGGMGRGVVWKNNFKMSKIRYHIQWTQTYYYHTDKSPRNFRNWSHDFLGLTHNFQVLKSWQYIFLYYVPWHFLFWVLVQEQIQYTEWSMKLSNMDQKRDKEELLKVWTPH